MRFNLILLSNLITISFLSITTSIAQERLDFPGYEYLGEIQPRTTYEIVGSDLWIGGEVLDRDYADYHAYKHYLDSLGAKKIRLQSGWAKTEKVKGKYEFAWLDSIINDALARKIQPWIQISYGNELYPGAGGISLGEGLPTSEEAYNAWIAYTKALVEHFRDRVNEWEIWNEADHRYNNSGPELYAELYYRTAKAVRKVQPNATIIGLSLAGVSKTDFVEFFFNYLQERDALDLIDVATVHGYPHNPDSNFGDVERLESLIYQYKQGLPLWQGETGCPSSYGSSGALSGHKWSPLTQAKWNLRRALAYVGRGYPFSLFTISEYSYDRKKFKGLNTKGLLKINGDLSIANPKPAYYAYQNLTALVDHRMERLPALSYKAGTDSSLSVFAYRHKVTHAPMVFIWEDGNVPSDQNLVSYLDFTFGQLEFKDPVLVDLLTGAVYKISEYKFDKNGLWKFKNIPVYDSPVAIADRALLKLK